MQFVSMFREQPNPDISEWVLHLPVFKSLPTPFIQPSIVTEDLLQLLSFRRNCVGLAIDIMETDTFNEHG